MLIILGLVLMISACAGGASPVPITSILSPTSFVETVSSNTQASLPTIASVGIICTDCHAGMAEMGDPSRIPWVNLPTCSSCHAEALTRSATTHIDYSIQKLTVSADALYPTITPRDNAPSIRSQGHAGPIVECEVCHMEKPEEAFWHFGGDE